MPGAISSYALNSADGGTGFAERLQTSSDNADESLKTRPADTTRSLRPDRRLAPQPDRREDRTRQQPISGTNQVTAQTVAPLLLGIIACKSGTGKPVLPARDNGSPVTLPAGEPALGSAASGVGDAGDVVTQASPDQAPVISAMTAPVPGGASTGELTFAVKIQPAGMPAVKLPAVKLPGVIPGVATGSTHSKSGVSGPDDSLRESTRQHADTSSNSAHKDKGTPRKTAAVDEFGQAAVRSPETDAQSSVLTNAPTDKSVREQTGTDQPGPGASLETKPKIAEATVDPPSIPAAPMKDLSLRIDAPEGQKVEVNIAQRAGDLQVAVRTADGDMVQSLRQGLSELTNRLADNNFHADTWRPAHAGAVTETRLETQNSSDHTRQGDAQSNSGGSQHERGQRQNNPNRPKWVEELESTFTAATQSKGESYGISS